MSVRLKGIVVLGAVSATLGFGLSRLPTTDKTCRLTFLSVGQGDCAVWQDGEAVVLIDVGPKTREGYDAGERIVIPKLRRMGIRQVALIILTHPDADHVGGLTALHHRYPLAKIAVSSAFKEHAQMRIWLKEVKIKPSQIVWIEGRSRIVFERSAIELAAPYSKGVDDNDGSLFARVSCGSGSAVLTGDASMAVEEAMQRRLGWRAQVLKAGHHGSRTSTSESFVKSLQPRWSVFSCGRENAFDHPHPSVLETLRSHRVDLFRTDWQGDIRFDIAPTGFVPMQTPWAD